MIARLSALALVAALLLAGCWSRREVNDLGVVVGMGVDLTGGGLLEVTLVIAQSGAAGRGEVTGFTRPRIVLQRQGHTITEAIRLAELASPRRLDLHHSRVVVLGERLAARGTDGLLDFLLRSPQIRLTSHIMLLRGAEVGDLFALDPLMEQLQSEALGQMGVNRAGLMIRLKDFFIARATGYTAPLLPVVVLHPHPTREQGAPPLETELSGAAIFAADRVARYLDKSQIRGAMWLRQTVQGAVITVPCPNSGDYHISARIERAERRIIPYMRGQKLSFHVQLTGEMHISDVQCLMDLVDTRTLARVQEALSADVRERVAETIRLSQAIPADPFGFGEHVRALLPAVWRRVGGDRWPQTWARTPVEVFADITLVNVQMSRMPPNLRLPVPQQR